MEDSLKGILVSVTLITLFITGILSFIVIFPQEQGVSFNDLKSNDAYLTINSTINDENLNAQNQLSTINNQSENSFNQWDITQGFMGSNAIKQSSASGVSGFNANIFSTITLIAVKLFDLNSPIVYAIGVIAALALGYIIYAGIKFVRQGE